MKIAINAWSIPRECSFEALFKSVSLAGFDGIELNIDREDFSNHSLSLDINNHDLEHIRSLSQQFNVPVFSISTSLYGDSPFGAKEASKRTGAQNILRQQLAWAQALDANAILVVPGGIAEDTPLLDTVKIARDAIGELKHEIEESGIRVGLENVWNGFFLSPVDMRDFIDSINSPSVGAYFDVGNVAVFSEPVHWIEILEQRIFKIHIKDFKRQSARFSGHFTNLYEGSINWAKIIAALKQVGYDDVLTAELDVMPQYPELLYRSTADAMRNMLK